MRKHRLRCFFLSFIFDEILSPCVDGLNSLHIWKKWKMLSYITLSTNALIDAPLLYNTVFPIFTTSYSAINKLDFCL